MKEQDDSLHSLLGKDAIPALQGIMVGNLPKLKPRFILDPGSAGSSVTIVDLKTDKTLEVGLCHARGAINALNHFID